MGFPVVLLRRIGLLRDSEEPDTDRTLSDITFQEQSCSCCCSFFLGLILQRNMEEAESFALLLMTISQPLISVKNYSPNGDMIKGNAKR